MSESRVSVGFGKQLVDRIDREVSELARKVGLIPLVEQILHVERHEQVSLGISPARCDLRFSIVHPHSFRAGPDTHTIGALPGGLQ